MSAETRQMVEVLLALSPWLVFACLIVWSLVLDLRDDRLPHSAAGKPEQRDEPVESGRKAA